MNDRTWQGVWRLVDPKITLASAASMLLGASLALHDGPVAWGWLALGVFGIFCLEAAKNASGEIYDWDSGDDQAVAEEDRSPFSGGKRVLVDGLLTRGQTWAVAITGYALGAAAGVLIAALHEPRVLGVGVAGLLLAFFYHAPPLRLAYRGLGELAVGLAYGPLICAGTYLLASGAPSWRAALAGLPLGLAIAGFLWVNELPDRRADIVAGKRTLVVRLGPRRAATAFAAIMALSFAGVALLPLVHLPLSIVAGLAGVPFALRAARRVRADPDTTRAIVPAQAWTLVSFVLMSVGASAGLIASRLLG